MGRGVEHLGDAAGLDHRAVLHHADPVGVAPHDRQVVADQQQSEAAGGFLGCQQLQDLRLDGHVQGGRRLIGDQQRGVVGQCHRDHHPLPLSAGQLMRIGIEPVGRIGKPDLVQ